MTPALSGFMRPASDPMVRWPRLSSPRAAAAASVVSLVVLVAAACTGVLKPLEARLVLVMAAHPLPTWYFPTFLLLGSLLPLLVRLLRRRDQALRRLLDPYLILLAGQIATEVVLVLLAGKGLGVVVGFWFTLMRLWQLLQLRINAARMPGVQMLFTLELVLWAVNALHIVLRRLLLLAA